MVEEKVKNKDLISEIMELENSELNAPNELVRVGSMTGMEYKEIKKEKILNRKVTYYLCNRIVVFIYE